MCSESRGGRRKSIDENTPGENAAAAEEVGEIAAPQTAESAGQRRDPEEVTGPVAILRRANLQMAELGQGGLENKRADQHHIDVEEKAHGRAGADGPLEGIRDGLRAGSRHKPQG